MLATLFTFALLATADPSPAPAAPPATPATPASAPQEPHAPRSPQALGDGPACGSNKGAIPLMPAFNAIELQAEALDDARRAVARLRALHDRRGLRMPRAGHGAADAPQAREQAEGDEQRMLADMAAHEGGTYHIDTTFAVPKGMVLRLNNAAGTVVIEGWSRDAVRLVADRDRHDRIKISQSPGMLDFSAVSPAGLAEVDYKVNVPEWMPLMLSALESPIAVRGIKAPVLATSIRGDVTCTGGSGNRRLSSVEGRVQCVDTKGDVTAGSIDSDVLVERIDGAVQVESVNGDVRIDNVASSDLDASSMAGSVVFSGPFQKKGRYRLSSHSGGVLVGVPDDADLDVSVATFVGDFVSGLATPKSPRPRGRRFGFTLGSGGSSLELESYEGLIQLVKASEMHLRRAARASAPLAPLAPRPPVPPSYRKGK